MYIQGVYCIVYTKKIYLSLRGTEVLKIVGPDHLFLGEWQYHSFTPLLGAISFHHSFTGSNIIPTLLYLDQYHSSTPLLGAISFHHFFTGIISFLYTFSGRNTIPSLLYWEQYHSFTPLLGTISFHHFFTGSNIIP